MVNIEAVPLLYSTTDELLQPCSLEGVSSSLITHILNLVSLSPTSALNFKESKAYNPYDHGRKLADLKANAVLLQ